MSATPNLVFLVIIAGIGAGAVAILKAKAASGRAIAIQGEATSVRQ